MAQIRIEEKRSGLIWIAAVIALIVIAGAIWLYARHRAAARAPEPATAPAAPRR